MRKTQMGALLLLTASTLWACDKGAAERLPCLEQSDCASLGPEARCLPVMAGESLTDFCGAGPFCPDSRIDPTFLAMPAVCDIDENGDGLADVYNEDGYAPEYLGSGDLEVPTSGGHLEIKGLFQSGCEDCADGQSRSDACCCGQCSAPPCGKGLFVAQRASTIAPREGEVFFGKCVPGKSAEAAPLGAPCAFDVNCASGRCAQVCVDGLVGSACDTPLDCLSSICRDQLCLCNDTPDCPEGQLCVSGDCLPQMLSAGAACEVGEQCASGVCIEDKCTDGGSGAACETDSDCIDGFCVVLTSSERVCSAGESLDPCNDSNDCLGESACIRGNCTSGLEGETCEDSSRGACQAPLVCTAAGLCSQGIDGSGCETDEDCRPLVTCVAGGCEARSSEAAAGVCAAAGDLGALVHDLEVDLNFDNVQPQLGGPSCGVEATETNLQRALRFELPGNARITQHYTAPDARRIFIREDCETPSSVVDCRSGGGLSSFGNSFDLPAGRYTIHIADPDNAPEAQVDLKAVYDFPSEGGGQDLGARLESGTCDRPTPVSAGEFHGATRDGPRAHTATCGIAEGPETVLYFSPQSSGTVCVQTTQSNFTTVLYVRQNTCTDGAQLDCNQTSLEAEVEFDAFAGTDYFIFVDTFSDDNGGGFGLILSEGQCP